MPSSRTKYRFKHSFTTGEITPLLFDRVDFERYKNSCKKLYNAYCMSQGPVDRRPGLRFIYSLNDLGMDTSDPRVRMVPFIFNEIQAYTMVFFMHTDGSPRVVFFTGNGIITFDDPPITECPPGTPVTPTPGDVVQVILDDEWDIEGFDWSQSGDEVYIAQSGLNCRILRRYDPYCWELIDKTFTDQPADWSDEGGWPERVSFHQQRLVFAATATYRQKVWMSQAGDFDSFAISSPLLASDAVSFTLDAGSNDKIKWLSSTRILQIGTLGNEWTVQGNSSSTAITPENIIAQRQTNSGSEPVNPLNVGPTTLFLEKHGRVINEFVFDYSYDSYKTSDMSILAPHMTEYNSIEQWAYQATPNSVIWCIRDDGDLIGITYQSQHQVVGWHHHHTEGEFKACTSIPGDTREDDMWFVVKREVEGEDRYYVEKLEDIFSGESAEEGRFLDSHLIYQGAPTSTISGLDHLIGVSVGILADGTVHPNEVVAADGSITLNDEYSTILVGYDYTSEVRPVLVEAQDTQGLSAGRTQTTTNIHIDFYRTLGGFIGRVDAEGNEQEEQLPFRTPLDLTGQQVPLFTGWYKYSFPEGFSSEVDYFIRQKQPLPMTIRSVVDEVKVNN